MPRGIPGKTLSYPLCIQYISHSILTCVNQSIIVALPSCSGGVMPFCVPQASSILSLGPSRVQDSQNGNAACLTAIELTPPNCDPRTLVSRRFAPGGVRTVFHPGQGPMRNRANHAQRAANSFVCILFCETCKKLRGSHPDQEWHRQNPRKNSTRSRRFFAETAGSALNRAGNDEGASAHRTVETAPHIRARDHAQRGTKSFVLIFFCKTCKK
jgi:hypothetical protein